MRQALISGWVAAVLLASAVVAVSSRVIFKEDANAPQLIRAAVAQASREGKDVILIFGANWCPDCHALDAQMHKPELARLIRHNFVVVNIGVGRFDRNIKLAAKYGVPISKGIPALAILSPQGKLLYSMRQGQFANAHTMAYDDFVKFFRKWATKRQ